MKSKGGLVVIPLELDAYKQLSFLINCDALVLLEGVNEVFGVCITCELDANIIDNMGVKVIGRHRCFQSPGVNWTG